MNVEAWEYQVKADEMLKELEERARVMAERKHLRWQMRQSVRSALNDEILATALRAQAWLEADPSQVSLDADGKLQCPAELPIGCGSDHIQAKIAERLFPDERQRADNAWLWSDDEAE